MNTSRLSEPTRALYLRGKVAVHDRQIIQQICQISEEQAGAMLADNGYTLAKLAKRSLSQLADYPGMTTNKAASLMLAFELGNRRFSEEAKSRRKICSSRDVYEYFRPMLIDQTIEFFFILLLNRSNMIIKEELISQGGTAGTIVDPKIVFKKGLELNAAAMILVHNHPSGNLTPSDQDKVLTKRLKEAGKQLDLTVLDHCIVTDNGYFSFADEGIL